MLAYLAKEDGSYARPSETWLGTPEGLTAGWLWTFSIKELVVPFPDVAVLLPGISGSVLEKDGREVWGTSTGALWRALKTGGDSIRELVLGHDDPNLDDLGDGVTATRLIPDLHTIPGLWKIDGYSATTDALLKAFNHLRREQNYFEFPYDWRRDNRVAARRLASATREWLHAWRASSGNANAKLILIGHSMGGLIARYFLEVFDGWRETRALITFGTPYRGSLNAVGYLANGYAKEIGPLKVDLSETLSSFTAVYQLLPIYPCVDKGDGGLVRVGETNGLPNIDADRARQALAFHHEIRDAQERNSRLDEYRSSGYTIFPIVGINQPTFQSAKLSGGRLKLVRILDDRDSGGDGTVPRLSATPLELSEAQREIFAAECHGSLQNFDPVLINVTGILSGYDLDLGQYNLIAGRTTLGLDLHDVYAVGDIDIRVLPSDPVLLEATVSAVEGGGVVLQEKMRLSSDGYACATANLGRGAYRVTVRGDEGVSPVTDTFLVVD